ncbi:UDP-4-amino-4,6-dideoxy-N-acetyl-beta-L-altrosamine transaminase [Thiohalocapsa sp. ML1]|jgi:UDP-4-amino-4,6-dideoxy-N-acetyl-beta-L-altrosamine transaminase|uniref:UDP-4-amino-4, 6-dideoxy-N-acetyl-beta-L-altrosamine transaminase n=1 Tax=Thiohalocapsa sp. ML1 TaxID=1431688 RepID=UPI0009E6A1B6|nr:UDP-4-amino-4,6-dideoxy-N-acetyl-beta-L-altrosamine transaminase [Thiohalocapsa sp. ML1]
MIPYGRQDISQDDIDAVVEVLRSDFITQGPTIARFEEAVADYCGVAHAVAVNSATSALHIACLALELAPGDLLWTSPYTFVASANSALYCGAEVDFVDIDSSTGNMSLTALEAKLICAAGRGRLPKVVMPVHFAGQSCAMQEIAVLSRRYGFRIIEDGSHAIGGRYRDAPTGCCRYCDITVFSFHPVKIITTGEGGMALTNNEQLASRMERLRSHGITRDRSLMVGDTEGDWLYEQVELGFNYRMTDLQAALGLSQLARLDEYVRRRHALVRRYRSLLQGLPVLLPRETQETYSAYHLFVVRLDPAPCRARRAEVFARMRAAGIGVNVHYIPVHTQPYYRQLGHQDGDFPNAETFYAGALTLPLYPGLTFEEQDLVVDALRDALCKECADEATFVHAGPKPAPSLVS